MIDWWQALLLSVAGALVGGITTLAVSYATHCWTTDGARKAEERASRRRFEEEDREAKRNTEEEERQARRQYRRDQIKPVQDFLEVTKRYMARKRADKVFESAWERNVAGLKDKVSLEEWRKTLSEAPPVVGPDALDVVQAFVIAFPTASGKPEMVKQLSEVFSAVTKETGEGWHKQAPAIASLEQLVEDYVTQV